MALLLGAVLALSVQSCNLDVSPEDVRSAASPVRAVEPTPTVEITSPARASFLAPGSIVVEGRVGQAPGSTSPVVTTTVEGTVVQVAADGTFQTTITLATGLNVIHAAATDGSGRTGTTEVGVLAGQWKPLSDPIRDAVALRINNPALDAVAGILEPIAATLDLTALTQSPIYDGSLLGGLVTARVDLANPLFRLQPPVRIYGAADGLHVELELRDLKVDVTAQGTLFGLAVGPEAAVVEADSADVAATLQVFLRPDRTVGVRVLQSSVTFMGFRAQFVSSTFLNLVMPLVRGWIETRIETILANKIVDLGTTLDAMIGDLLSPSIPPDVFGMPFPYTALGSLVTHDTDGFGLVLDFDAPPLQLTARGAAAPGSFSTPSLIPPSLSTTRGISLVIDDDMINRALHSAWAAGIIDNAVDQLIAGLSLGFTAGDLARFLPEVLLAVSPTAALTFQVEAGLPPLFEVTGAPDLARLSLSEIILTIYADEGAGPVLLARIALSVRMGVTVVLEPQFLRLSSTQLAELSIDVLDEPLAKIDARQLRLVLGTVVPLLASQAVNRIHLVTIPPQIAPRQLVGLQAFPDAERLRIELDVIR